MIGAAGKVVPSVVFQSQICSSFCGVERAAGLQTAGSRIRVFWGLRSGHVDHSGLRREMSPRWLLRGSWATSDVQIKVMMFKDKGVFAHPSPAISSVF